MEEKRLIVIADAHLGTQEGDTNKMITFLQSLDPQNHDLLFLGDLFHIWAGPRKYHTSQVTSLFTALHEYKNNKGHLYLVVGNRDVFFPEVHESDNNTVFPFSRIALDELILNIDNKKLLAIHGDTVNTKDLQYLKWRSMIRHKLFRFAFSLIPAILVKKIMFSLERKLKNTNMAFRKEFPFSEWESFLEANIRRLNPAVVLAGHFHPEKEIITKIGESIGIVVPSWADGQKYLEFDHELSHQIKVYN